MQRLIHVMGGLAVGGMERVVLDLARRARADGLDHRLLLFDTPFRDAEQDFDPGDVPVTFVPRRPGWDWGFVWRLARHIRSERPNVVHTHEDTALCYVALARSLLLRKPRIVATFHASPPHATPAARKATRLACGRANAVVCVSPELRVRLQETGWIGEAQAIWNGIDPRGFSPDGPGGGWRERLGGPPNAKLIGHLGRAVPVKRQEDLIEAARQLVGHDPPLLFVLAGDGPERTRLAQAARDVPNVHLVPRVADVAAFLREVELLVLCSDHEGAPRVALEAMASGCPLIMTPVGGVPEMVGEAARWVPPRQPAELAGAIRELVSDASKRADLVRAGLQRVPEFSFARTYSSYEQNWRLQS